MRSSHLDNSGEKMVSNAKILEEMLRSDILYDEPVGVVPMIADDVVNLIRNGHVQLPVSGYETGSGLHVYATCLDDKLVNTIGNTETKTILRDFAMDLTAEEVDENVSDAKNTADDIYRTIHGSQGDQQYALIGLTVEALSLGGVRLRDDTSFILDPTDETSVTLDYIAGIELSTAAEQAVREQLTK